MVTEKSLTYTHTRVRARGGGERGREGEGGASTSVRTTMVALMFEYGVFDFWYHAIILGFNICSN